MQFVRIEFSLLLVEFHGKVFWDLNFLVDVTAEALRANID